MAESVSSGGGVLTGPSDPPEDASSSSGRPSFSKPSLSYIALIAKVLLSSPSKKLNLASIYRAMEERFPHLRSRAPGWRNSVRHNLSVNDCFVKVSRCRDGRGHHWGVHRAHLRDFQQGDFTRKAERRVQAAGCPPWPEAGCVPGRFCDGQRVYHVTSPGWTQQRCPAWRADVPRVRCWTGGCRLPDWYEAAALAGSPPGPFGPLCSGLSDALLGGTKGQHVSVFATPPVQELRFPGCRRFPPAVKELIRPLPYKVNFSFHP